MDIGLSEREKYKEIWQKHNYRSASAIPFAKELMKEQNFRGFVLEVGSGDGTTANYLTKYGYQVMMSDITLEGMKEVDRSTATECSAWKMPFPDGVFDTVISTDVLEHIPTSMVLKTVDELKRVCKPDGWQFHRIATFEDKEYSGHKVHLTVKDIMWWHSMFQKRGVMNFKLTAR